MFWFFVQMLLWVTKGSIPVTFIIITVTSMSPSKCSLMSPNQVGKITSITWNRFFCLAIFGIKSCLMIKVVKFIPNKELRVKEWKECEDNWEENLDSHSFLILSPAFILQRLFIFMVHQFVCPRSVQYVCKYIKYMRCLSQRWCILIQPCFISARKERKFWDGQKAVFVVLLGSTVVLPCVNRRPIWTEGNSQEDQQQVVHWDRQPPGVRHDLADRLIDLYASGERRHYGPLFVQRKMNISATAFSQGDFSLIISDIQPLDQGLYSCHLHHHYCGLHERRIFQLTVTPPIPEESTDEPQYLPSEDQSKRHSSYMIVVWSTRG